MNRLSLRQRELLFLLKELLFETMQSTHSPDYFLVYRHLKDNVKDILWIACPLQKPVKKEGLSCHSNPATIVR